MEASQAESQPYIKPGKLHKQEYVGMVAAGVLALSLFLPWFTTSDNPNSQLNGEAGINTSAWEQFAILDWLLLAACIAPFILSWIVMRSHKLSWRPGEVTAIVGITACVLILCNGVILGRPGDSVEIGLGYGYFVALLGAGGILVSGFLRQSEVAGPRKPPGEL
ncbi:MAG: hypothetical protein WD649_06240 [Thermoleophilaceae bacterium]